MSGSERLLGREFLILAAATSLFFLGMGAANPLTPQFVVDVLGGTETTAGVVMGSFAISSLLLRSWYGRLGDRHGSRRLVVTGGLLGAAGMATLTVADSVALAIGGRLVLGAGQAAVMTGSTVLAITLAPESRRGEAASYILVAFHVGLGLGPIGGELLLEATSYRSVWLVLAGVNALGAAVGMLLRHRPTDREAAPSPWINRQGIAPGAVSFFGIVSFVGFTAFVPLYAREIGLGDVGFVFALASISIAVARIAFGKLPDLLGPIRAGTMALVATVAGSAVLAFWASPVGVYVAAAVLATGMSLQTPSFIPIAVDGVPERERSSAMATFTMFLDLSIAVTGPVTGLIVSGAGYRTAFLTGGVAALVGIVVLRTVAARSWNAGRTPVVDTVVGPVA
jgi:MFS family permease